MRRGICLANVPGDLPLAEKFRANFFRVSDLNAIAFDKNNDSFSDYYVTIGTAQDAPEVVARKIFELHHTLSSLKPLFYAVINEINEIDFSFVEKVRELLPRNITICKGAHTSCTERSAYEIYKQYFEKTKQFIPEKYHVLHFYLKPMTLWNCFDNWKRLTRFRWIVKNLHERGVERIIIGECHDGDKFKRGFPDHGDFVYATKKGVDKIYDEAKAARCYAACYYHAPFLSYPGNTVLEK